MCKNSPCLQVFCKLLLKLRSLIQKIAHPRALFFETKKNNGKVKTENKRHWWNGKFSNDLQNHQWNSLVNRSLHEYFYLDLIKTFSDRLILKLIFSVIDEACIIVGSVALVLRRFITNLSTSLRCSFNFYQNFVISICLSGKLNTPFEIQQRWYKLVRCLDLGV